MCAVKNLTVFVADSPRCLEWSSIVAAVSRALRELSEPCLGWTRERRGQTRSLGARRQYSQATVNNVLPVMTGSPAFLTRPPPGYEGFSSLRCQLWLIWQQNCILSCEIMYFFWVIPSGDWEWWPFSGKNWLCLLGNDWCSTDPSD